MPDVSVVIPSFRGGRFLRESVASVQSQTLEDWELIIVLDGCDDDLSDIERKDERVRIVRQRQRGVSIARNVGIGHAGSELIAFLDDDDRMLPDRLFAQYREMKDERVGICHTQYRLIDENGASICLGDSRESQYGDFLRGNGSILLSSTMMRKSLILEVGGFNSLMPLGEDLDLIYRVARESTLSFLPDVLAEYRRHGTNIWLGTSSSSGEEMKLILRQHHIVAEAKGEAENLQSIRLGMASVLPGRAVLAMSRAHEARFHRNYIGLLWAVGQALLFSPRAGLRVVMKAVRRDMAEDRSLFAFIRSRIKEHRRARTT